MTKKSKIVLSISLGATLCVTTASTGVLVYVIKKQQAKEKALQNARANYQNVLGMLNNKKAELSKQNDDNKFNAIIAQLDSQKTKFDKLFEESKNSIEKLDKLCKDIKEYLDSTIIPWEKTAKDLQSLIEQITKKIASLSDAKLDNIKAFANGQLANAKKVVGVAERQELGDNIGILNEVLKYLTIYDKKTESKEVLSNMVTRATTLKEEIDKEDDYASLRSALESAFKAAKTILEDDNKTGIEYLDAAIKLRETILVTEASQLSAIKNERRKLNTLISEIKHYLSMGIKDSLKSEVAKLNSQIADAVQKEASLKIGEIKKAYQSLNSAFEKFKALNEK
ncbi:Uncharacterised protein [Metamycoplasma arthritidis]|uniref:Hypothetical membrane protein n=1 Tax=Metamycoplasma arthritidis (strain 158L3-1) TaxID=243272 RepID=B3PNI4_META1|nr:hypothetical protein [Metamycoplasma arthritidis]ACF07586.1 hypothetical membrane protein [Metamycoplasma arthritidis 158L3-1]VEU79094.1 Uncharacterised protein [Metamycoplasma arthritidis]